MDIAVVGGTGAEGFGLTLRLAAAGHHVTIGSRDATRGAEAAARAVETLGGGEIDGTSNEESVPGKQLVVVTVPFIGGWASTQTLATSSVLRPPFSTALAETMIGLVAGALLGAW